MYRLSFHKAMEGNSFQEVYGWGEKFQVPDGTTLEFGLEKIGNSYWHITEVKTGMGFNNINGNTRKEILKEITPDFLQKVSDILKEDRIINRIIMLAEYKKNNEGLHGRCETCKNYGKAIICDDCKAGSKYKYMK